MIDPMCYSAAVPLLVYVLLQMTGVIDRTDTTVNVLLVTEAAAVILTIRGIVLRYRPSKR